MYLSHASPLQNVALPRPIRKVSCDSMGQTWYERARQRMAELGLKQPDLMKPLGVETRGAVGHYLRGRRHPDPQQLAALARVLHWSLDELLLGTPALEAREPAALYVTNEELLAQCMRFVDRLLADMRYPKRHPIRAEPIRADLVANVYRLALEEYGGKLDADGLQREIRDKIRLLAKVA